MLLYFWINEFKHIKQTGFNLSSQFEFDFKYKINHRTKKISGTLTCLQKNPIILFDKQISDVKAIIGENGAGKSTLIELLVNFLMQHKNYFDGFLVTDEFVFNRNRTNFGSSIKGIKCLNLTEIRNVDLVNQNRDEFQKKLKPTELKDSYTGQLATSYLNDTTIVHYSPLLNYDRIGNAEGLAGSSRIFETDYWHYYDVTTENTIVNDYYTFNSEYTYFISGESELLAHKNLETLRILDFILSDHRPVLPFTNKIENVVVRFNDFYEIFWMSIDQFLKPDAETEGRIESVISAIRGKDYKGGNVTRELESNLYVAYIYGALKYEYKYRLSYGHREESNALLSTMDDFLNISKRSRIHKTTLEKFLATAKFCSGYSNTLFKHIQNIVEFILDTPEIKKYEHSFFIPINQPQLIQQIQKLCFEKKITNDEDASKRYQPFDVFSFEMDGLSSGEKNIASFLARLYRVSKTLPKSQKKIVLLLDEPEVTLHPQWQVSFINILNQILPKLFTNKKIQLLITSHSPILISDLPKNNILFLEKEQDTGNCTISKLKDIENTFGANIHALYSDAFFMRDKGGTIGEFAKHKIKELIKLINDEKRENIRYIRDVIDIVGEPLIKNQLNDLFYSKFPEQKSKNIDDYINSLENLLKNAKKIKSKIK